MHRLLGDEARPYLQALLGPAQSGLRVNTLKLPAQAFKRISPFRLEPLPWSPAGFLIDEEQRPGLHPYHAAGLYYLQEPSAQAVAEILAPQPGERVLDLAAAPGGKSTQIAARMQNQGLLVANDPHTKRVWDLMKNLERWGTRNAIIVNETPERLAAHFGAYFDRVLVDAPCSGEGMFRKGPQARREWSRELVQGCALRQENILNAAAALVRPGGWLAYSTCTFNPIENESIIARFLQEHPGFDIQEPARAPGFSPGRPDWVTTAWQGKESLARTVRIWPHQAPGEGHFIALLRRTGGEQPVPLANWPESPILASLGRHWEDFSHENLSLDLDPRRLRVIKSYLYYLPTALPDLRGLRSIRPGWWLGSFKKNRFEPAHAFAMGLRQEQVPQAIDLDSRAAGGYLRREPLSQAGPQGWVLVTVDGYPLGWGKRVNNTVKNHYPKGLRWN